MILENNLGCFIRSLKFPSFDRHGSLIVSFLFFDGKYDGTNVSMIEVSLVNSYILDKKPASLSLFTFYQVWKSNGSNDPWIDGGLLHWFPPD